MQSSRPSNDADNIFSVNYEDTKKSRRKGRRTNEPFSNIASFVYRVKQLGFTSFLADYFAPHTVQGLCILFNIWCKRVKSLFVGLGKRIDRKQSAYNGK